MKQIAAIFALITVTACASSETRRSISASGDPSEIFFEKEIAPMDQESKKDLLLAKNSSSQRGLDDLLADNKPVKATTPPRQQSNTGEFDEVGYSSWYGSKFQGKPTASGEIFDKTKLTAAHPNLPLGSVVRVKNLENDKEVLVKVNDRGPFVKDRIIDLSEKAADSLEFKDVGIARVGLTVVSRGSGAAESEDMEGLDDEDALLKDNNKPEKLTPKKVATPAPLVKGAPKGQTVQVGVFRNSRLAEDYRKNLSAEYGEKVYLFERDGMFVLQMGDFTDRAKADILKSKLKEDGVDCFIPKK
ncbi:septal ring lytic transglycosylase RlpA family protein [Leptospira langatensis]|uniref:Probable endolytic peptidoglycan transglycosylase RlpA n=1 Tax=Leptospira langatensis TaxID=2484983 RepID=A0A5F1ZW34_9LEPT|nr:septal ring lytic transglycosylase RlpA family protein [Leptospira langatensis]TGK03104.1 septal ring lytic transglycosylase RlpA family protein [Leptospira langatensis]TGL41861.1 septal ring lytic transglycosylase RlpA family protein [Leptospira langatensis]